MRRVIVVVVLFSQIFTAPVAHTISLWELAELLDIEHCFIPYYRCVPLGCG